MPFPNVTQFMIIVVYLMVHIRDMTTNMNSWNESLSESRSTGINILFNCNFLAM